MTDTAKTAVALLVDRSGSMDAIRSDAQGAINDFVARQAERDGTTVRIAQFDTHYEVVTPTTPATQVPPFTLRPRGATALLDAWYKDMVAFGEELSALAEEQRPGTVVYAVVTDGQENSSKEVTRERVLQLVTQQREVYNWEILYLAANQDAVQEGAKYGVAAGSALSYTDDNYAVAVAAAADYVTSSVQQSQRGARYSGQSVNFSDTQRTAAVKK